MNGTPLAGGGWGGGGKKQLYMYMYILHPSSVLFTYFPCIYMYDNSDTQKDNTTQHNTYTYRYMYMCTLGQVFTKERCSGI